MFSKRWWRFLCISMLIPAVLSLPIANNLCLAASNKTIRVPAGSDVLVEMVGMTTSETAKSGDQVMGRIANDVFASGYVVIRRGTPVIMLVEQAKSNGMVGAPGSITVALKSTSAVDGSMVALSGSKTVEGTGKVGTAVIVTILCCIFGLMMKGTNAEIIDGAQISGRLAVETAIVVNE